ncbi:hypothetical protein NMY22_g16734 [Coprinellus aureogranulatus]|nr:hypothetical protein NMY22_g16734 [Coprinellus aureogranulatus]
MVPVVTVQPTIGEVVEDVRNGMVPSDKFWVSLYKTGESSVHTKVNVELDEKNRDLVRFTCEDAGVTFELQGTRNEGYRVSAASLNLFDVKVHTPCQEYIDTKTSGPPNPKRIEAFDISPDASRFATAYLDGSVHIYPTSSIASTSGFLSQRVTLNGSKVFSRPHSSAVNTLRFFPSSRVLLTSGLDFALTILPADLPDTPAGATAQTVQPARILRGHKRSVTSTAIIGVGRNVLSSSVDGTVKLWDVPSGDAISTMETTAPVLCMSMGQRESPDATSNASSDEREVPEVQSNVVFAGLQDGTFELFDLSTKKSTYHSQPPPQSQRLTSIAYSPQHHALATGSNTGAIVVYDVRSLDTPVTSFVRQDGEILDLAAFSGGESLRLAVATSDGLPYVARVGSDGSVQADELIGVDCDPVRNVRVLGGNDIWLSSDDSVVRRYAYRFD